MRAVWYTTKQLANQTAKGEKETVLTTLICETRESLSWFGTSGRWHCQHLFLHRRPPPWQPGSNYGFLPDWWPKRRSWMWLLWAGSGVGMYNMRSKVVWPRKWQLFLSGKVQKFITYSSHCFTLVCRLFPYNGEVPKLASRALFGEVVGKSSTSPHHSPLGTRPHILDIEKKNGNLCFPPPPLYFCFFPLFLAWYGCYVTQNHQTRNVVGKTLT